VWNMVVGFEGGCSGLLLGCYKERGSSERVVRGLGGVCFSGTGAIKSWRLTGDMDEENATGYKDLATVEIFYDKDRYWKLK